MSRPSPIVRDIISVIRTHRLTYDTFRNACHAARKHLDMKPPKRGRQLPKLLTEESFRAYMAAVSDGGVLQHEIMLKILFYTGVRNDEMCDIKISDIDLAACRIYIDDGKGGKDRYVLFAEGFKSLLRAYLQTLDEKQVYLFESSRKHRYTTRRIQQIVKEYAAVSGIPDNVHPHLMRHQALTWLKKSGLDDAQIQLISGHSSRKSLEVYTHLGLGDVSADYQEAMRKAQLP